MTIKSSANPCNQFNEMKTAIIKLLKVLGLYKTYKIPDEVIQMFTLISETSINELCEMASKYCSKDNYSSEENRKIDIDALSFGRLNMFRSTHIPFLFDTIGLKGKKVLEIGCGSGASSICLSEQGAKVTGIDVDAKALEFAKKRAKIYKQEIDFLHLNATGIEKINNTKWDIIIYFASLEHMTPQERKETLSKAFNLLENGKHLCVFGTPNRLWPEDIHTSFIPFYMWLQDELAVDYARFSSRKEFNKIHERSIVDCYEDFYRWGRGCSFHDFHVALGNTNNLKVLGSLPIFLRRYSFIQRISYRRSLEFKYKNIIQKFGPKGMHPGFYECYLDLIIEK